MGWRTPFWLRIALAVLIAGALVAVILFWAKTVLNI
jgi:hypothetical protein